MKAGIVQPGLRDHAVPIQQRRDREEGRGRATESQRNAVPGARPRAGQPSRKNHAVPTQQRRAHPAAPCPPSSAVPTQQRRARDKAEGAGQPSRRDHAVPARRPEWCNRVSTPRRVPLHPRARETGRSRTNNPVPLVRARPPGNIRRRMFPGVPPCRERTPPSISNKRLSCPNRMAQHRLAGDAAGAA